MDYQIDIPKYIRELLYEYGSVTIPNLGQFTTQYQNAAIETNSNQIQPPVKHLAFNDQLKVNDGQLIEYISQKELLSNSAASQRVMNFVNKALERLATGQTISLPKIGELRNDRRGGVDFAPFTGFNFASESYGLDSVNLPPEQGSFDKAGFDNSGFNDDFQKGDFGNDDFDYDDGEYYGDEAQEEDYAYIPQPPAQPYTPQPQSQQQNLFGGGGGANVGSNKTVSQVLAKNMRQEQEPVTASVFKKRGGVFWLWLLPLLIAGLFLLLLYQLSTDGSSGENNKGFFSFLSGGDSDADDSEGDYTLDEVEEDIAIYGENDALESEDAATTTDDFDNFDEDNIGATDDEFAEDQPVTPADEYGEPALEDEPYIPDDDDTDDQNNNSQEDAVDRSANSFAIDEESGTVDEVEVNVTPPPPAPKPTPPPPAPKPVPPPAPKPVVVAKPVPPPAPAPRKPKPIVAAVPKTMSISDLKITQSKPNEYVNTVAPQGHYIIVGAFKSATNADKLADKLQGQGLTSHVLQTNSGYYRTGIYVPSGLEAVKNQFIASQRKHNKSAWILYYQ